MMLKKKYFKTKDECEVTFEFEGDAVESVALVSESNDWKPVEMKKRKKDGIYFAKLRLPNQGQFQYRYLVDGQNWVNDDAADAYVTNEFGSQNSIVDTYPSSN
jgi:1,4-alpha-glucan branching enzyme